MKVKYFSYLLASCVVLSASKGLAMFDPEAEHEEHVQVPQCQVSSFKKQLEQVQAFVAERKAKGQPLKMILGATNREGDRFPEEEGWIFFDMGSFFGNFHDPDGRPYLEADFNKIEDLKATARAIGPSLSQIIFDIATFKFTEWRPKHLKLIVSMLSNQGELVFPPFGMGREGSSSDEVPLTDDEEIRKALVRLNPLSSDIFPREYKTPEYVGTPEDLNIEEAKEELDKYASLRVLLPIDDMETFFDKADELGISDALPLHIVADEEKLKKCIMTLIKKKKVEIIFKEFEDEIYLPNLVKRLKRFFGEVIIERDVSYPIEKSITNTFIIARQPLDN